MVELLHIRQRYVYVTHRRRTIRQVQGLTSRCCRRLCPAHTQQQSFHVEAGRAAADLDGTLHLVKAMVGQQVQDADIVLDAASGTMLTLQVAA